jgi:hypothetical protein
MKHKRGSRRHKRGGSGSYSSASSYNTYVNGNENSQFDRVFSQSGPYASVPGNMSIGAQGQNANMAGAPNANNLALIQTAGKGKKRGGNFGTIINQALVPASLLAMQQNYKRNKSQKAGKRGGFVGEVINQALVPASLLTLQQNYKGNKTQKAGKHGGFVGEVINQALVPASLLAMQQNYRRNKTQKAGKRGGFVGEVINQAFVPASLLAMQQTYRRKNNTNSKSRRRY